jgi:hypothetical protein
LLQDAVDAAVLECVESELSAPSSPMKSPAKRDSLQIRPSQSALCGTRVLLPQFAVQVAVPTSKTPKPTRKFHPEWKQFLPWLLLCGAGKMCCSLCLERGVTNSFTEGSTVFTTQTVQEHARRFHLKDLPSLGVINGHSCNCGVWLLSPARK